MNNRTREPCMLEDLLVHFEVRSIALEESIRTDPAPLSKSFPPELSRRSRE